VVLRPWSDPDLEGLDERVNPGQGNQLPHTSNAEVRCPSGAFTFFDTSSPSRPRGHVIIVKEKGSVDLYTLESKRSLESAARRRPHTRICMES
jgi:hypothetical protein